MCTHKCRECVHITATVLHLQYYDRSRASGGSSNVSRERAQDAEARQRERALLRPRGRVPLTNKQTNSCKVLVVVRT